MKVQFLLGRHYKLIEGNKILVGGRTTELTLAENPTVDDRCESNLKSSGSLKQEIKYT